MPASKTVVPVAFSFRMIVSKFCRVRSGDTARSASFAPEPAAGTGDAEVSAARKAACQAEFQLTQECLGANPKSYPVWFHREWVMKWGRCAWQHATDLKLTTKLLQLDERNFHCWTYRRFMARVAKVPAEGLGEPQVEAPRPNRLSITISSNQDGDIVVCAADPDANRRLSQQHMHRVIAADTDLGLQLLTLWPEVRDANLVA